jgi:hypothetical protein
MAKLSPLPNQPSYPLSFIMWTYNSCSNYSALSRFCHFYSISFFFFFLHHYFHYFLFSLSNCTQPHSLIYSLLIFIHWDYKDENGSKGRFSPYIVGSSLTNKALNSPPPLARANLAPNCSLPSCTVVAFIARAAAVTSISQKTYIYGFFVLQESSFCLDR